MSNIKPYCDLNYLQLCRYFKINTGEKTPFITKPKYGYQINISHELINPMWKRFKEQNDIPPNHPASDTQRLEFENAVFLWLDSKLKTKEV